MNDFVASTRGVEGGDGGALLSGDGGDFFTAESRFPAGEDRAVRAGDVHNVAGAEFAG